MGLKVEKIASQTYILLEDISVDSLGYHITVKQGFDYDSASIPQIFWSLIGSPFTGNYTVPALIHDALYASERLEIKLCDNIFLDLMKQYKVGYFKRYAIYYAVRVGGGFIWDKHLEDEIIKYKGFCDVKKIINNNNDFNNIFGV